MGQEWIEQPHRPEAFGERARRQGGRADRHRKSSGCLDMIAVPVVAVAGAAMVVRAVMARVGGR